jgi:hypothetical protein
MEQAVGSRDSTCRITDAVLATENAHLIPKSASQWFARNSMEQYGRYTRLGIEPIDTPTNGILLRRDIHHLFDLDHFVIVPKGGSLVIHVIHGDHHNEVAKLYHNIRLHHISGISKEYVFARFAQAIFRCSSFFFRQERLRTLILYDIEKERYVSDNIKFSIASSRNSSPTKRNQSPTKRLRPDEFNDMTESNDEEKEEKSEQDDEEIRGRSFHQSLYAEESYSSTRSSVASSRPWSSFRGGFAESIDGEYVDDSATDLEVDIETERLTKKRRIKILKALRQATIASTSIIQEPDSL